MYSVCWFPFHIVPIHDQLTKLPWTETCENPSDFCECFSSSQHIKEIKMCLLQSKMSLANLMSLVLECLLDYLKGHVLRMEDTHK